MTEQLSLHVVFFFYRILNKHYNYKILNIMLLSRTVFNYFIYSSLYLLIPNS